VAPTRELKEVLVFYRKLLRKEEEKIWAYQRALGIARAPSVAAEEMVEDAGLSADVHSDRADHASVA